MRQFGHEPAGAQSYEQAPPPMSRPVNTRPGRRAALSVRVEPRVVASIARFDSIINRVAAEKGMDGNIIRGIIAAESGGNPNAGSGGGYKGLMQAGRDASQYDPETSIRTGAGKFVHFRSTISTLLRRVGINLSAVDRETTVRWVATSYNAGPGTVIKAVRYAAAAGNAGNWMQPEHFQRALIHTGAYSIAQAASSCLRGQQQGPGTADLIAAAGRERVNLKGRDLPLAQVRATISPLLLCAIEFKHRNIPRYVERILTYVRHFDRQASSPARESFEYHEDGFGIGSNYVGWQSGMNRESGFGRDGFGFETNSQEWEVGVNRSSADYIKWVQESLNRILGLRLATDGAMGPQTRSAIRSFQRQKGLVVDGLLGSKTEAALIAAGAAPRAGISFAACPPRLNFVDCPVPGSTPTEILDHFAFKDWHLDRPRHRPQIIAIAGRIINSQSSRQPIRSVLISGHTDPTGSDDFNFGLGRQRAEEVTRELCTTIEAMRPGLARQLRFELTTCGERQQKATPELSRRVELFLPTSVPTRPEPPRPAGGPPRVPLDLELLIRLVRELLRSFIPILGVTGVTVPTTARFLTVNEQAEAKTVFGESLDFSKILIADGTGFQNRPFTVAVPVSGAFHVVMLLGDIDPWHIRDRSNTLIHELTHAWQSQHADDHTAFMKNSVRCQVGALADLPLAKAEAAAAVVGVNVFDPLALARGARAAAAEDVSAYAYIPGRRFDQYAAEQIAQQVEDGYINRSPIRAIVTPIQSARVNARDRDNEASLQVISFHRKSTPGVIFH